MLIYSYLEDESSERNAEQASALFLGRGPNQRLQLEVLHTRDTSLAVPLVRRIAYLDIERNKACIRDMHYAVFIADSLTSISPLSLPTAILLEKGSTAILLIAQGTQSPIRSR
jgi:hypothetical protein